MEKQSKSKFIDLDILEDFDKMQQYFSQYDDQRENIIKISRDVIKLSKKIIYKVQSQKVIDLDEQIKKIQDMHKKMLDLAEKNKRLLSEGSFNVAEQELVEAILFKTLIVDQKLLSADSLNVKYENYVLGLADLSGELIRIAVISATHNEYDIVYNIKDFVDELYYLLLNLHLRTSEFRRKFDSVKYALKKLDEICYDISRQR